MKIKLLEYLKRQIKVREQKQETQQTYNMENIEVIIENDTGLFESEVEIIKQNAIILYENKLLETIEDGIIITAVIFRGLKRKKVEKDKNGKITITLLDASNQKVLKKE